jgi:hypothetical protein
MGLSRSLHNNEGLNLDKASDWGPLQMCHPPRARHLGNFELGRPPGSFHTGDVFVPHEALPNRWKLIGLFDDMINMSTSESFVALPLDDHIRSHPLFEEAVVLGNRRSKFGLLVFASEAAKGLMAE